MGLLRKIAEILSSVIENLDIETRQPLAIILVSFVSAITSAFVRPRITFRRWTKRNVWRV